VKSIRASDGRGRNTGWRSEPRAADRGTRRSETEMEEKPTRCEYKKTDSSLCSPPFIQSQDGGAPPVVSAQWISQQSILAFSRHVRTVYLYASTGRASVSFSPDVSLHVRASWLCFRSSDGVGSDPCLVYPFLALISSHSIHWNFFRFISKNVRRPNDHTHQQCILSVQFLS